MREFTKRIKLIIFCKVCGVEFRPPYGSWQSRQRLCVVHRRILQRERRNKREKTLTPEYKKERYKKQYPYWKKWVANNLEKRRRQALESFHRRKHAKKKTTS